MRTIYKAYESGFIKEYNLLSSHVTKARDRNNKAYYEEYYILCLSWYSNESTTNIPFAISNIINHTYYQSSYEWYIYTEDLWVAKWYIAYCKIEKIKEHKRALELLWEEV